MSATQVQAQQQTKKATQAPFFVCGSDSTCVSDITRSLI
jgi:hypothetical protein